MDPIESAVRNLFTLQRLMNGVALDAELLVRELFDEIIGNLAKIDPTGVRAFRYQQARVKKILELVRSDSREAYRQVLKEVRQAVAEVGVQQAAWMQTHIVGALEDGGIVAALRPGMTGVNQFKAALDTDFVRGRLLRDWFSDQGAGVAKKVEVELRIGLAQGETLQDLIVRVRGRSTGSYQTVTLKSGAKRKLYKFEGGAMQATTRDAKAVARTATNHVANDAHFSVYEANADIVTGYRYLATLDGNTTPICRALDGQIFRLDDPNAPRPPQHWQCRSDTMPIIEGLEDLYESGTRSAEGGPVRGGTTYEGWLRSQGAEKQNEILGPTRAKLFRSGKVGLRDMVRNDGSVIRISDLT